jgi:hypothetical protein
LRVEVLEIALISGTLHQSEALWRLSGESGDLEFGRIGELSKYAFAGLRFDQQSVRIVYFRTIVIETPAVGFVE